uniref:Uncharacterized protein n=1 Tax=Tanacetum cinerariifolium TaxID=118510 RepID=A0A6L2N1T0_TANCI|nr:hypothetical protein [Tanacetum cinerariifolium]
MGVAYEGSSGSRGCLYAQLHGLWRKSFMIVSQLWFLLTGLLSLETGGDDASLMSIDSKGTNVCICQGEQGFTQDVTEKSKLSLMAK